MQDLFEFVALKQAFGRIVWCAVLGRAGAHVQHECMACPKHLSQNSLLDMFIFNPLTQAPVTPVHKKRASPTARNIFLLAGIPAYPTKK